MPEVGDIIVLDIRNGLQHPEIICEHQGELCAAHMTNDGAFVVKRNDKAPAAIYRCKKPGLGALAAQYAMGWSVDTKGQSSLLVPEEGDLLAINGAPYTRYATRGEQGRYYGYKAHRNSGRFIPFGHDALYRALKWAGRMQETMSRNKGFTCDVFIAACFHAAAINLLYGGNIAKIQAKAKALGAGRSAVKGMKLGRRGLNETPTGKLYENSVLPQWSNVGAMHWDAPDIDVHWRSSLNDVSPLPERLADVFTAGLLFDAKFTPISFMLPLMDADKEGWQRC